MRRPGRIYCGKTDGKKAHRFVHNMSLREGSKLKQAKGELHVAVRILNKACLLGKR